MQVSADRRPSVAWISWTNVALGVWLVAAAFLFRHQSGAGITENVITGSLVALAALWSARAFRPRVSLVASWTVMLTGIWVLSAPFAVGYERETIAVVNDIIVGLAILVLGLINVVVKSRYLAR